MIKKNGKVEVTENEVFVHGFEFEVDNFDDATIEAVKWAIARLRLALIEGNIVRKGDLKKTKENK